MSSFYANSWKNFLSETRVSLLVDISIESEDTLLLCSIPSHYADISKLVLSVLLENLMFEYGFVGMNYHVPCSTEYVVYPKLKWNERKKNTD